MEQCARNWGAIAQPFSDRLPTTCVNWDIPSSLERGVICPQPVRATRDPCLSDSGSVLYCKPKRLSVHRKNEMMDVLNFFLDQDDHDDGENFESNFVLCGSPPVRSSNPVVRDSAFGKQSSPMFSPLGGKQSSPMFSPLGSSYGGVHSPRVGRSCSPCGSSSSSFSSKPPIRVEGFSLGSSNSRSHCVVSALA